MPLIFEDFLKSRNADELKQLCRPWGGGANKPKAEATKYLQQAINTPESIRALLGKLGTGSVVPLTVHKLLGGRLDGRALVLATTMLKPTQDNQTTSAEEVCTHLDAAKRAGLLMGDGGYYSSFAIRYSYYRDFYIDERVCQQLPNALVPTLLNISAAALAPNSVTSKRSTQSVVLDILNALKAVDTGGPLHTRTTDENFRIPDLKRVSKAAGWGDKLVSEFCILANPTSFFLHSFQQCDLIISGASGIYTAIDSPTIDELGNVELVRKFVSGVINNRLWLEHIALSAHTVTQMRVLLLTSLACLPPGTDFYSLDQFERCIFDRVGMLISSQGVPARKPAKGPFDKEEVLENLEDWRQRVREHWIKIDVPWINTALTSWLYRLGLVELVCKTGNGTNAETPIVECFRVTDLYQALFMGKPQDSSAGAAVRAEAASAEPVNAQPWIVQPNFDVLLYINEASSSDLNFLEQISERVSMAEHVASYRLTKNSISTALSRIGDANRIITGLKAGAKRALPANVVQQITDWASSINRVTITRSAELLEFESEEERTNFIASKPSFASSLRPVGERFLISESEVHFTFAESFRNERFDYSSRAYSCRVNADSEGRISLRSHFTDLRHCAALNRWTDPIVPRAGTAIQANIPRWRLTKESVSRAINKGCKIEELHQVLEAESWQHGIPEVLAIKLSVWAGKMLPVTSEETVVFNFDSGKTVQGLLSIEALNTLAAGALGTRAIVVRQHNAKAFVSQLKQLGIEVASLPPAVADKPNKT